MKPKSFRHLTPRSRKRVLRRIARRWADCANNIAALEDEIEFELRNECFSEAAALHDELLSYRHRLAGIEHELEPKSY